MASQRLRGRVPSQGAVSGDETAAASPPDAGPQLNGATRNPDVRAIARNGIEISSRQNESCFRGNASPEQRHGAREVCWNDAGRQFDFTPAFRQNRDRAAQCRPANGSAPSSYLLPASATASVRSRILRTILNAGTSPASPARSRARQSEMRKSRPGRARASRMLRATQTSWGKRSWPA